MDNKSNPVPTSTPDRWPARLKRLWAVAKRALPFAAVILSAFAGALLFNFFFPPPIPPDQDDIDARISEVMASATPPPAYSSEVYQAILPSLVFIQTEQEDVEEGEVGIGSGVVVNENGDILTAYHVVEHATAIEINFADGSRAAAQVLSADPEMDIAVLHPAQPPELIVPAVLGSAGAMRIGDEAFVVGNPLGLSASMSAGVISGFGRSTFVEGSEQRLEGLIQFDTAVNPGSSGGPLLNRQGQVVGIVTGLANPTDQNFFAGIGFAVPIGAAVTTAGGGPEY